MQNGGCGASEKSKPVVSKGGRVRILVGDRCQVLRVVVG